MRLLAAVLACALLSPAGVARAYVPELTPERRAEETGRTLVAQPAARGTLPGVLVARSGVPLFARNADRPFVPASIMKLATTAAAMRHFEPGDRFTTRALGTIVAGHVDRLTLVGGGDPTLATRAYRRERFLPEPTDAYPRPAFPSGSPTIEDLARMIRAAGVASVGRVVVDDTLFDARRTQPGWRRTYLTSDPDTGLLSALTINEGMANLDRTAIVPDPAVAAGAHLVRALREAGVRATGAVVRGAATDEDEIARVSSPPVGEIVDFILRYSINFPAEMLLKSLGARVRGEGSTAAGVAVVRATLRELGIPLDGFRMTDGSGLSILNRMTPRTVAAILDAIRTGRDASWRTVRAGLPVAGRPGTLLTRMTRPPAGGNLRGKTGMIRDVRAMAGWVRARDGVDVTYVAMFNDAPDEFALTTPLDLFGVLLALFPYA